MMPRPHQSREFEMYSWDAVSIHVHVTTMSICLDPTRSRVGIMSRDSRQVRLLKRQGQDCQEVRSDEPLQLSQAGPRSDLLPSGHRAPSVLL